MTVEFLAEAWPADESSATLAGLSPDNPFSTAAYAAARASAGAEPWLLAVGEGSRLDAGCYGFLRRGRLTSRFEVHSLPELHRQSPFWTGLAALCRDQKIHRLHVNTFGSSGAEIWPIGWELERRKRCEFHLRLAEPSLWQALSSNHKRAIKRAKKAGLTLVRSRGEAAGATHARVQELSMRRRSARGEQVSLTADAAPSQALLEHGAGEIFQAIWNDKAVSSLLILRAATGAYYHSAGSTPEGMTVGAAHFLVSSVAETLLSEGLRLFNLGGAGPGDEGLTRFKAGFGAEPVNLDAAQFLVGPPIRRACSLAAEAARSLTRGEGLRWRSWSR